MSHVEDINLEIKDIEAMRAAAKELGGELVQQSTYEWWGTHVGDYPLPKGFRKEDLGKCEYAIKVPGTTWEIGLAKARGSDHYTALYDFFGSKGRPLEQFIGGREGYKLKQTYAVHAATNAAKRKGWMVQRKQVGNKIELTITGM